MAGRKKTTTTKTSKPTKAAVSKLSAAGLCRALMLWKGKALSHAQLCALFPGFDRKVLPSKHTMYSVVSDLRAAKLLPDTRTPKQKKTASAAAKKAAATRANGKKKTPVRAAGNPTRKRKTKRRVVVERRSSTKKAATGTGVDVLLASLDAIEAQCGEVRDALFHETSAHEHANDATATRQKQYLKLNGMLQ